MTSENMPAINNYILVINIMRFKISLFEVTLTAHLKGIRFF